MTVRHEERFVVALPQDRVWEVMSDTQHLNELFFGLNSAALVSRDKSKARLRGTFGVLAPEYDEYPWVFEVPRRYESLRVFPRGVLGRLRTECTVEPDGDKTAVRYAVDVDGRGPLGALVAHYVALRTARGVRQARTMLEGLAHGAAMQRQMMWPPANPYREATLQRATPIVERLAAQLTDDERRRALRALLTYVADATDADVARMRPYELARAWGTAPAPTLAVMLLATKAGLLRLSWDLLCPGCDGATQFSSLRELPNGAHCEACDLDFGAAFEENVEATFAPEPVVRPAERVVFCHGSPSSTRGWLAQLVVAPGAGATLAATLGPGRYRVQGAGAKRAAHFEVKEGLAITSATATIAGATDDVAVTGVPALAAGPVTITVDNTTSAPQRVQLAHRAFASLAATAADVTSLGLFRELFGNDALAPGQHLRVGRRTIMFTDLVGSTAMYEALGDAAAYGLVRRHFEVLTQAVVNHGGSVVKTVGDAVMGAFDIPKDAVAAGLAAIKGLADMVGALPADGRPTLRLKVGVHTGPCLAIEANGVVDYFGRTVNIAARVESVANPNELVLSWAVLEDEDARAAVEAAVAAGASRVVDQRKVKGIAADVEVTRLAPRLA